MKEQFNKVDILVNNTRVYSFAPLEAITEEEIDRIFSTNVKGLLLTTKAAGPLFPAEGGSIINIGSVVSEPRLPDRRPTAAARVPWTPSLVRAPRSSARRISG